MFEHDDEYDKHDLHAILHRILHTQEAILMALDKVGQAILDAVNASTTATGTALADVSDAIKEATQAITDLVAKVAAGQSTPAELQTAIQPALDTLNAGASAVTIAADALKATASAADPAVNPAAPPIPPVPVVPAP